MSCFFPSAPTVVLQLRHMPFSDNYLGHYKKALLLLLLLIIIIVWVIVKLFELSAKPAYWGGEKNIQAS